MAPHRGGVESSDSGDALKTDPARLAGELEVGCEKKRDQDDARVSCLSTEGTRVVIEMGRAVGGKDGV